MAFRALSAEAMNTKVRNMMMTQALAVILQGATLLTL